MLRDFFNMEDGIMTLSLRDKDFSNHDDIFLELDSIITEFKPSKVELNMKDIQKLNSNGIGRLVNIRRYFLEENGIHVTIINLNPVVLKTLKSVKVNGC
jgi:hypothetical protein